MAITASLLTNGALSSATDASSYETSSLGTATGIILAFYEVGRLDSTQPAALTGPSGQGLTWSQVAHYDWKTIGGTSRLGAGAWLGVGTPSAGEVTWTIGYTAAGFSAHHIDITGALNAATADVQFKTLAQQVDDDTEIAVTLDAGASDSNNRCFAAVAGNNGSADLMAPRANWTELTDTYHATPNAELAVQWRSDAFEQTASSVVNTGLPDINHGIMVVEIAVAAAAASGTSLLASLGVG